MNVQHVNAICRATKGILSSHLGVEVEALKPSVGKGSVPSNDISVILGVKGDLKGQIICTFSSETSLKIVSAMMGGMQIDQLDEMGWSAVQEFGNWVAGTTATELSKEACIIDVTPPVINEGESKFHSSFPYITVPLGSSIGEINVHISVSDDSLKRPAM
ncbi:chemotaxis protein CheX [Bacillus sp. FJAT-45037]|uniref:chemotaxis protein CheX n=1 Tax=Bacillus sp. FJAT-45037 TaxID=2011007 RepID=UPI000C245B40|nr:chemotaxis protein CheX [Bacillus sp. FJAT-45037]